MWCRSTARVCLRHAVGTERGVEPTRDGQLRHDEFPSSPPAMSIRPSGCSSTSRTSMSIGRKAGWHIEPGDPGRAESRVQFAIGEMPRQNHVCVARAQWVVQNDSSASCDDPPIGLNRDRVRLPAAGEPVVTSPSSEKDGSRSPGAAPAVAGIASHKTATANVATPTSPRWDPSIPTPQLRHTAQDRRSSRARSSSRSPSSYPPRRCPRGGDRRRRLRPASRASRAALVRCRRALRARGCVRSFRGRTPGGAPAEGGASPA